MKGEDYCYIHNPHVPENEKKLAQSLGWKSSPVVVKNTLIENASDVANLLSDTLNRVRTWEISVSVANSIGYLSNQFLKAKEVSEYQDKLDHIHRAIT